MRSALIPTTSTRAQNPAVAAQRTKEILRYPACVHCPEPSLTLKACSLHVRGIVALEATISERGRVEQIAVLKALDYGLTERAIKAVGRWRISPAIGIDGKPRAFRISIMVTFGFGNLTGGIATG